MCTGGGVRDLALPLLENLGGKLFESSFLHLFYANRPSVSLDNNLQRLIPIVYSVFNVLFLKCVAH